MSTESKSIENIPQAKRGRKRKIATVCNSPKGVPEVVKTSEGNSVAAVDMRPIIPAPPLPTQTLPSSVGPALIPDGKAPRHNSQNFYTSLLEQKGLRYKVNKWLGEHAKFDVHSETAVGCWKCNLAKDFQCGDINLFEAWYMMKQENKNKGHTCPKRIKSLFEVGAYVPAVRCVQSKNGWCRCQDWAEVSITEN